MGRDDKRGFMCEIKGIFHVHKRCASLCSEYPMVL